MFTEMEQKALQYITDKYNGGYSIIDDILFINIKTDVFKICLSDKKISNCYFIFHKNNRKSKNYNYPIYHFQSKAKTLLYVFFKCTTHYENKKDNYFYTEKDYSDYIEKLRNYNK